MPTSLFLLSALALPAVAEDPAPPTSEPAATGDDSGSDSGSDSGGDSGGDSESVSDGGFAVLVGLTAVGRMPMGELSLGFVPAVEAGVRLPVAGGRLALLGALSGSWGSAEGTAVDERMPESSYSWTLQERELVGGLLFVGRAFAPGEQSWSPELVVGPQLHRQFFRGNGSAGGSDFGEYREQRTRVGLTAAVGVAAALGPGELTGRFGLSGASVAGDLTGQESGTLGPMLGVGYRLVL